MKVFKYKQLQDEEYKNGGVNLYSLIIYGGEIVDGTGAKKYKADIAIEGDKIAAIGPDFKHCDAETKIDANGLVVAPGFIDMHSHTDASIFRNPLAESKIMQGITSDVTGNCGIGAFPVADYKAIELEKYLTLHNHTAPADGSRWQSFAEYADKLDTIGLGLNLVPLVAHGALRIAAMGSEDREPTAQEMQIMEELLEQTLQEGAWGLSTGLIYPPGSFARTPELIALSKVLARHKTIYASHVRGESNTLLEAVDEAIRIGRESGARIEVSHLKAIGKPNWGKGIQALKNIEAARKEGVDVAADQYPYTATSTGLTALVPSWAHAGGVDLMLVRLADPALRERLNQDINKEMDVRGGADKVMITSLGSNRNEHLSGKTIAEIAKVWGCAADAAVIRLLAEEEGAVGAVYFSLSDIDLEGIISNPEVSVGTDGYALNAELDDGEATHPRSYGTFPRVLGLYVREKKLLSLETAIHKMTAFPAERLGLYDRGLIKEGLAADLTIFDPASVNDCADFINPHRYPVGIEHVIVNGRAVVAAGKVTGVGPGKVLRKK